MIPTKHFNPHQATKLLIFITLTFLFIQCRNTKQDSDDESSVICVAKLRASCDIPFSNDSSEFYLVDVNLINNSDSIVKFMANNCATYSSILFNPDSISMLRYKCAVNYPTIFTLNPGQTFTVPLILNDSSYMTSEKVIKFGFILADLKYFKNNHDPSEILKKMRENKENVIWSQAIKLSHLTSEPFEIKEIVDPNYKKD